MARPRRINLPFTLYHVFSRTNTGGTAFFDSADREKFLSYLSKYATLFEFRVHAWCLMDTHFHLLLENSERPALSEFMKRLLTAYTVYFNRRHQRHGHLFQGRYKSLIVDKASHLLAVSRYIHLNPALTANPNDAETYEGSSLRYFIHGGEPPYLYTAETLSWFQGDRQKYAEYVREGLTQDVKLEILQQSFVGGKPFADRVRKRIGQLAIEGSRADKSRQVREERISEAELRKADAILKAVGKYKGIAPESIRNMCYAHGETGLARKAAAILMREHLPWAAEQIAHYLGLKGRSFFTHLIRKRNESGVIEILEHAGKIIK